MQKRYTKLGIKASTIVVIVVLFFALIGTLFMGAIRGIPSLGIGEYFLKTDIAMWEVWLISIAVAFIIGK